MIDQNVLQQAFTLIDNYVLCDNCLGRQFGALGTGLTNAKRGKALKTVMTLSIDQSWRNNNYNVDSVLINLSKSDFEPALGIHKKFATKKGVEFSIESSTCELCNGLFSEVRLSELAAACINQAQPFEYLTFLVGSIFPGETLEKEDELRARWNLSYGESIKSEFNRELGKVVASLLRDDATVDFLAPDIVFVVDIKTSEISLSINPLFVSGKYRKLQGGISQSVWHCKACRGAGCEKCDGTGKKYLHSVEEFIVHPMIQIVEADDARFHGSGREDVDARMLGTGRPFVVELKNPKKRYPDLKVLETAINEQAKGYVEVELEDFVKRNKVRELKTLSSRMSKKYELTVEFEQPTILSQEKIEEINTFFTNKLINQRTPQRVAHRRANLIRTRKVHSLTIQPTDEFHALITIHCEGGLYVKELATGDDGRTDPNLAELIGVNIIPK
ncbi:MAG: tRNA pseudouridine(54/55) synthase Pus10, partial [Promethearchaeota archaeon]